MSDVSYAMRVVKAVQDSAEQTSQALQRMKTPQAAFEERRAAVNAIIDKAFELHDSAQSRAEEARFRSDILVLGVELHQLCQDHQATRDAKNKDFEHQQRLEIENLCCCLVRAVGADLFQRALRNSTKNPSGATGSTSTPAGQPTPPATESEPEVASPAEHPARSPPASSERPVRADAGASSTRKRRTDTEPESHGRRKRTAPNGKRISCVWYDEIYQKGHAETKHIIVEHPKGADLWYIIRCQDCPRDFKDTPLRSAGAHLQGLQHRSKYRDAAHVVEKFGIRVLECDKEKVEENNAVARRAFRRQEEDGPRPADDTAASGSRHGRRGGGGIVSPTPGQIYLGYWNSAKKSWPVLLLPTANLEDVGVPGTLEDLKLLPENLPSCYRYDTTTKTLDWEEGFEDGGAKVAQREFPVLFFEDGVEFPSDSQPTWLAAKDLDVLDIESAAASDIPHIRSVRTYLRARGQIPSEADPPSEMVVHDDAISQRNGETHQTPEPDERNSPETIFVEPCGTQGKAGPVPVVNERSEPIPIRFPRPETSIGAAGYSDNNLRRSSFQSIISISSTPASESHETHPDEAAVSSPNKRDRTAPDADMETTTSTNISVNNPDQLSQANTVVEATVEPRHLVPNSSAAPAQTSESLADYLRTIAMNGLDKKVELSNSIPPGNVQQVAPRRADHTEDNTREVPTTYADFYRQLPRSNHASDTQTNPPRAEFSQNPFSQPPAARPTAPYRVPNPNHQHQGPNTPQVENRSSNSAVPSAQSQSQPRPNTSPAPYHHDPRFIPDPYTVQNPDPRRASQPVPSPRWSNQGTAPHANHHGVSDYNRAWLAGNGATHSQAPSQGSPHLHQRDNGWNSINGHR